MFKNGIWKSGVTQVLGGAWVDENGGYWQNCANWHLAMIMKYENFEKICKLSTKAPFTSTAQHDYNKYNDTICKT